MEEYIKKCLEEKAFEINNFLNTNGFLHSYDLLDYGINFRVYQYTKMYVLSLSFSPKRNRWTARSENSWVKETILPLVLPLLDNVTAPATKLAVRPGNMLSGKSLDAGYFAEACECLRILEPFAQENIDFSIIGDYVQRGIQRMLNDPLCTFISRSSLLNLLEQPIQSDFKATKEYLLQCLTMCRIPVEC